MDVKRLSAGYRVRKLTDGDVDAIYGLCRPNGLFYRYNPPVVTRESILRDMNVLPPGKTMKDKHYIGFFDGDMLVAVMDLILGYPDAETAFIGFFMTDVRVQNRGIGSGIFGGCRDEMKALGYAKIRLGVDKGNSQSFNFWTKNGFRVVDEDRYIAMELLLK